MKEFFIFIYVSLCITLLTTYQKRLNPPQSTQNFQRRKSHKILIILDFAKHSLKITFKRIK